MPKGLDYIINIKDGSLSGAAKAKAEVLGLDRAVEKTGKNMSGLGSIARNVGGVIAGAMAIGGLINIGTDALASYQAGFVKASAQVNSAIISTNGAAGRSLEQMRAQADDIESKSLFDDADILTGQSLLLTFTNIKGAVFDQAIPAIADMAQRMAGDGPADLKGASIQVGKALNDPIKGITALSRVGVSFTEQQKSQIEQMVKMGDTAGAQTLILKELNTEFGGSAAAARNALGPQGDYAYLIGETKEALGALISDGLSVILPYVNSFVTGLKSSLTWMSQNKEMLKDVAIVLGIVGGSYLLYQGYLYATTIPLKLVTAGQFLLNAAMTANPIGIIVVGIGLLITGLYIAYKRSETFRAGLAGIVGVASILSDVFIGLGKTILGALTFNKSMFLEGVKQSVTAAQEIASGGLGKAFNSAFDNSITESRKKSVNNESAVKGLTGKGKSIALGGDALPGTAAAGDSATTLSSSKQVRNVNVSIAKLVENLTVNTTNLQGTGSADIKRMITEILTGAVHDSELALS